MVNKAIVRNWFREPYDWAKMSKRTTLVLSENSIESDGDVCQDCQTFDQYSMVGKQVVGVCSYCEGLGMNTDDNYGPVYCDVCGATGECRSCGGTGAVQ